MTLASYQMSYNGVVLGDGTSYDIVDCQGLEDLDNVRSNDIPRARDHGEWGGADYATGRDITLTIEVTGTSDANFRSNIEALMAATVLQPSELPLQYVVPGIAQVARQVLVKPRKRPVPLDIDYTHRIAQIAMLLHGSDFRVYDSTVQSLNTTLPTPNGGVHWPTAWPISWGSSSGSGTVTCNNAGNFGSRPVISIVGPVDNPSIQNNNTGQYVTFAITLLNTDTLTIDMNARTVTLNGTANRRNAMTADSNWWELAPGNTVVAYRANTLSTGSVMTITWQSAWT